LVSKDDPPALAVKKLSQFLKNPPFRYERRIKQTKEEPVLNFLFTTHQGWCEHFVSALALLLRSGGIPARVVGGYYGGSWNERGHYYLVKQKEAHAWVEYWDGNTWQRTDPTPISEKTLYFHFLSKWLDYLRLRWYAYVINYDFSKQKEFFQQLRDYVKPDKSWYKIKKPTTFPWDSLFLDGF
jgi:hypothetical protein